jgi:predicted Abi (CAAX) family protease
VIVRRALGALVTRPSRRDWAEAALAALAAGAVGYALGMRSGLFRPGPSDHRGLVGTALLTLVTPALGEELVFRGALIPSRTERPSAAAEMTLSTALFTLWHVLEARTFLRPAAPVFLRVDFLLLAALEGAVCAVLRRRSGSIWTCVALHWAEVMVWKLWLGGPSLASLAGQLGGSGRSSRR